MPLDERDLFDEKEQRKTHNLMCPHCHQAADYEVAWLVRTRKKVIPRGADERDRAKFAKLKDYMVRRDDLLGCKNIRCRKRFEITALQSVVFLD
jgi:hypothetical protein